MKATARMEQLKQARKQSRIKPVSLVVKEEKRREFLRYEDGQLVMYDRIGKEEDQVRLTPQEVVILQQMENARQRRN